MRFVVVGDTTLDVTVRGATIVPGSDRPSRISAGPGGQGANLAVRLARRGGGVVLVTALADDLVGQQLRAALRADGVTCVALPAGRSGIVVSLVDAAGERAMLSDRRSFDVEGLASAPVEDALGAADWIHVSGYPLADPQGGNVLASRVGSRRSGQRCSVGGGSFATADGPISRIREARPDLLLFDRAEATTLLENAAGGSGARDAEALAEALAAALVGVFGSVAVVTDGAAGAAAATGEGSVGVGRSEGPAVVDATGAGDAYAAVILLSVADGAWPPSLSSLRQQLVDAGRLGAEVAGVPGAQARVASETSP